MTKLINGERVEVSQEEETQILAENAAAEAEKQAIAWIYERIKAYGSLAEELDMLYHDIDNECLDKTGEFYLHCKSVKDSIPKPEEE